MALDIDAFDASLFNPAEWIGTGKTYKDVPLGVALAAQEATAIPSDIRDTLPQQDEPILVFIQRTLPMQSSGFNTFPMHAWFSCKEPSAIRPQDTLENIMRRTIPSRDFINKLVEEFGQQWLDGKRSIVDPRYNQGHDRYPFWVLTVWREILLLINKQKDWREAYTCIAQEIKGDVVSQVYPDVETFLGSRGWNSEIKHGGFKFTSYTFAQLLCKRQLCDDVTQAMISVLQQRLKKSQGYPHHVIAASRFYTVLQIAADKKRSKKNKLPLTLKAMEDQVRQDPDMVLWFPVLHSGHEVAICVDFRLKEIRYGDTIPTFPPPNQVICDLQAWLKSIFGYTFAERGNSLRHGVQADAISCIPGTMNTIAHGIFDDPLWTPDYRFLDRMKWFHLLVPEPKTEQLLNQDEQTDTPSVLRTQPLLPNLLNPLDDAMALADIVDSMSEAYDNVDIPEIQPLEHHTHGSDQGPTGNDRIEPRTSQNKAWENLFVQKRQQHAQKRARSPDHHLSSHTNLSTSQQSIKKARSEGNLSGPVGLSRSARSERAARQAADGNWDPEERRKWKDAILQIDAKAQFYEDKPRAVRCSNCGGQRMVKTKNETRRFHDHYHECIQKNWQNRKGNVHVSRTSTLTSSTYKHLFSHSQSPSQVHTLTASTKPKRPPPCPGLSAAQDVRIPTYLKRTSVSGGGARSVTIIAKELFSKRFLKLTSEKKDTVLDTQRHEQAWTNDHQKLRVFSNCCTNVAYQSEKDKVKPCHSCRALLKSTRFRHHFQPVDLRLHL